MSVFPFEPGRGRGGLADDVCRRIADEIVLGNFAPGSRLDEVSLAARFSVSRTPIREALKQLAIMGLVDTRPNRGSVVAELSVDQLDQMFEAIGELEAACARAIALGAHRYKSVASILKAGLDRQPLPGAQPHELILPTHANVRGASYYH